jgi:hypothetical protein
MPQPRPTVRREVNSCVSEPVGLEAAARLSRELRPRRSLNLLWLPPEAER